MDLPDCYRLLGLRSGASFAQIKASYRRLAQQYHPDTNPDDNTAKEKFIAVTEAYKMLLRELPPEEISPPQPTVSQPPPAAKVTQPPPSPPPTVTKVTRKEKPSTSPPLPLSETEHQLKWNSYQRLQQFFKYKRFPQAIALVEALAQRLPTDPEVRQWQAIAYQQWGRQLINEKQLDKARIYLKKALKTDPHNKSLWSEVERDFRRLEQIY